MAADVRQPDDSELPISISHAPEGLPSDLPAEYHLLLERLRAGKVVLCAGAALGHSAGRPTWRDIVERLLDRLAAEGQADEVQEARALLDAHPLTASGFVKRRLGADFRQALSDTLPKNGVLPEMLQVLGKLPFRAALTTSFDDLLERAFVHEGTSPRVYTAFDAEEIRRDGRGRYILQIFGSPDHGPDVIFGAGDLRRVLSEDNFRHVLRDLYHKRSFLFLGFDPNDPDFEILIDRLMVGPDPADSPTEPQHFAVLPGISKVARQEIESAFGIRVLPAQDALEVVYLLREAVGEHTGEILPDDDDLEGWLRVLSQEPTSGDAIDKLDALERRLFAAGDSDRLIELWLGRVDAESEPSRRAECLRRVAELLERDKGQMAEAFHTLLAAYKEDPQPSLLEELERLAGTTGQWVELLSALREVIGQLPTATRADVWVRIARLYGDKLNHLEYALTSLSEAQKLDISDEGTREKLRELRVELNRRAEHWKELADALGALAAHVYERERQIDLYLEQGDIYESRLSDGVSAAVAFRKALDADPQNRDVLTALELLLRRHRNWPELVVTLDDKAEVLELSGDVTGSQKARREAAAIATEHLSDPRRAVERWEAIRKEAPRDLDALHALEKLYSKEGSFSEHYLSILTALADAVTSDKERLSLYRRLAAEYEELPGHNLQAAACMERILDIDPNAEDAYRGLERLYRLERKWVLLVDTYRRHARNVHTGRADLYAAVGRIYEVDIPAGNPEQALLAAPQAIEAWNQVLELEPEHPGAMEALSRLYQQTESYEDAIRLLDKRANLSEDKTEVVLLRHQAARLTCDHLRDYKKAEERFVRALEVEQQHMPTLMALVDLYRKQGENLRAAKLLIEAEQHTQNRLDKTRYLVEAGDLHAAIDDPQRAAELYLRALAVDPEHAEAGVRAADILWRQQRHAELVPILEMLTRKESDREEQCQRLARLGQSALATFDDPRALKAFTRAAELDPGDLISQRGRAKLLMAAGHWQEASDASSAVLLHHHDDLPAGERVELFFHLGECERHLERRQQAKNFYAQALEIDPSHRPTLQAELLLSDTAQTEQIDIKRALLRSAPDDEKVLLLTEIGDLQAGALKDIGAALSTYREALALRPGSHILLHKCLDLLSEQKNWPQVMDILDALIQQESSQRRRARYKQTAALLYRDELKDYGKALALFNAALDDDPTLDRSANDLEKLALEQKEYRELARIYKRKIKALGPDSETSTKEQQKERLRLWSALGQLCVEQLRDGETALAAFEVGVALDRANLDRRRQLASLYVQAGPDRADKAILEHQVILRMHKGELASYRALKNLYLQVKQREKAAAVAYALHILRKADPDDEKLVAEVKARPLTPARRPLKQELWRTLNHPEEDMQLGALFQAVLPNVQLGYARTFKEAGINRKERLDPQAPQLYAKALRYGVEVLDTMVPEAYLQPDQKDRPYTIVHCSDKGQQPVICVQLGAPLLNPRRPEREVMYEIGRLAALLRPKRALRTLLGTAAQLGMIIDAAIYLGTEAPGSAAKVVETAQGLKRSLAPTVLEQVSAYGRTLRDAGTRGEVAASAWLGWSDMTSVRAGLVLAGDLETVAVLLATDPPGSSPLSPKQRLLDLLHFSVTEEYFTIRQHLGLMG